MTTHRTKQVPLLFTPTLADLPRYPVVGRDHPDTSVAAVQDVGDNDRHRKRAADVVAYLLDRCELGATDDEIDAHFGWGHQTTTPVTNALRKLRLIEWNGTKRKTRKGRAALVNYLPQFVKKGTAQ